MSDYKDILKSAKEKGILLDSCGLDERQKWNGLYNDLCGMSVEDALQVQYWHEGGSTGKKSNTITFELKSSTETNYELVLSPSYAPTAPVSVSFTIDNEAKLVTIPAGSSAFYTGIMKTSKYASIKNIATSSEDESYTYKSNNKVQDGKFTLTYISATGGIISTEKVEFGTTVTLPDTPTEYKTGYTYYWHFQGSETPLVSSFTMPEQDTTVVGKAIIKQYTITYKISGETDVVKTYDYQETILKYNPSKTGYSFSGWDTIEPDRMPAQNLVFNGTYTVIDYTLTYYVDGEIHSALTYHYNDTITPIDTPTKEGYTFGGWQNIPAKMPANNVRVDGAFSINSYTITYHIDGLEDVVKTYQYGAIVTPYIPIKEGHTFQGWDIEEPATMPAENLTRIGTMTANVYTLTYYVNGVSAHTEQHNFEATITPYVAPTVEGYTFSGWDEEIPTTMPSHNVDIHGTYNINTYKLIYYVDNVKVDEETYEYNQAISAKTEPTKEGYTFSGWGTVPTTMPSHNVELRGTFSINTYTLTYKVDGEDYYTARCEYNSTVEVLPSPSKEGYTFSGWSEIPSKMPAYDLTIIGSFSINSYTLTYKVDGAIYSALTVEYNTSITSIADPEPRVGYTFTGWIGVPIKMPSHNVDVLGTFEVNSYTLEYYVDGKLHNMESYVYKHPIDPVAAPEKTGYDFVKWENLPETMPANDVRVDALYKVHTWVATYNISGEGQYTAITYNYGEAIAEPTPPARSGYTFAWDSHPATMPDNNITINGKYNEIVAASDIYYGTFPYTAITATTTAQVLGCAHIDGTKAVNNVTFIIPGNPEYTEIERKYEEGEITKKQFKAWLIAHNYAYTIVAPSDKVSSIILTDEYGSDFTLTSEKVMTINGAQYTLLDWTDADGLPLAQGSVNVENNLIIKIN